MSGRELMREGQAAMPDLLPDYATRKARADSIERRARKFLDSDDTGRHPVGFFLLGVASAARETVDA